MSGLGGQSGNVANGTNAPLLTDTVEKGLVIFGEQ